MKTRHWLLGILVLLLVGVGLVQWFTPWGSFGTASVPGLDVSDLMGNAVPRHVEALADPDAAVRKKAARALWQIGTTAKDATPVLLERVQDPNAEVRALAVQALGRTSQGTTDAIGALAQALTDKDVEVRVAATGSLVEIWHADRAPKGADAFRHPREDREEEMRREGRSEPEREHPEAAKRSAEQAPVGSAPALSTAAQVPARPVIPLLVSALRDPDARVRARAAEALAEAGLLSEPAVEDLTRLLEDPDATARLEASIALGRIGPSAQGAVPALVRHLGSDEADGVRANCADALGRIHAHPEQAVPTLVEAILKERFNDIRGVAIKALLVFGPEASRPGLAALEKFAKDPKYRELPDFAKREKALRTTLESRLKATSPAAAPASDRAAGAKPKP